jgi:molybdopterin adenylyltransferase
MHRPHPDAQSAHVDCAIITVSDTRTIETDRSGQLLQQLLRDAGHSISSYEIVPDEPEQITAQIQTLCQSTPLDAVILNGGTGIAPRDTTYEAIARLLEKELPGFGELFRWLSYQEIGSRAMTSRAIAGVFQAKLIFSLPGSTNAVRLATEKLILPELGHLTQQIKGTVR